jgi:heat shock transcription factor, other eukaryote
MPPANSRKRPAPGSSPTMATQQMQQDYSAPTQLTNDQFLRWSQAGDNTNYADPYNMNSFVNNAVSSQQYQQPVQASSTQLARRPMNRQMVPTAPRATFDNPNDPWGSFGDDNLLNPQNPNGMEETDNIELLEEKAMIAKRDAQSKRKQIPPFVQKLSR